MTRFRIQAQHYYDRLIITMRDPLLSLAAARVLQPHASYCCTMHAVRERRRMSRKFNKNHWLERLPISIKKTKKNIACIYRSTRVCYRLWFINYLCSGHATTIFGGCFLCYFLCLGFLFACRCLLFIFWSTSAVRQHNSSQRPTEITTNWPPFHMSDMLIGKDNIHLWFSLHCLPRTWRLFGELWGQIF